MKCKEQRRCSAKGARKVKYLSGVGIYTNCVQPYQYEAICLVVAADRGKPCPYGPCPCPYGLASGSLMQRSVVKLEVNCKGQRRCSKKG